MDNFEKLIPFDNSKTEENGFEKPVRIEKSDLDYFRSCEDQVIKEIREELGLKNRFDPYEGPPSNKDPEYYKDKVIDLQVKNEKSKSKKVKGRPKKNNSSLHRSAMEGL